MEKSLSQKIKNCHTLFIFELITLQILSPHLNVKLNGQSAVSYSSQYLPVIGHTFRGVIRLFITQQCNVIKTYLCQLN